MQCDESNDTKGDLKMAMDVRGKNPADPKGVCFRNNIWWWHPLAQYCCEIAPDVTAHCQHWHSNDYDGLNATDSCTLAEALQRELDCGRTAAYAEIRDAELKALPDEPCDVCGGTGKRLAPPDFGAGDEPCRQCNETGRIRPLATGFFFSPTNVEEFVEFLRHCGGFVIA
jgi:hypothetical protein